MSGETKSEAALLDLLEDVWAQFSLEVRERPGARHDGGLSTLEEVREALIEAGRLYPAGVEGKDWFVFASELYR